MDRKTIKRKAATPTTLRERCLGHFAILGIPITPDAFDAALLRAEKEALSPLSFVEALLGEQVRMSIFFDGGIGSKNDGLAQQLVWFPVPFPN